LSETSHHYIVFIPNLGKAK